MSFNRKDTSNVWNQNDTVDFYIHHRQQYDELYESEKFFLNKDFVNSVHSVLDIGCAAGGMSKILRHFNADLTYIGLDVSDKLIQYAKQTINDPLTRFECYDGIDMPFKNVPFDLVFSSGVLHLVDHYRDVFAQMVERSQQYVLTDFRVTTQPTYTGKMKIDFSNQNDSSGIINYHVINFHELLSFFKSFKRIKKIEIFGYKGNASNMSEGIDDVYMVFFKFFISDCNNGLQEICVLNQNLQKVFFIP
jgi:SAM-dependent methyltransferase